MRLRDSMNDHVSGMATSLAFFFFDRALRVFGLLIFWMMPDFFLFASRIAFTSARRFRSAAAASFSTDRSSATCFWIVFFCAFSRIFLSQSDGGRTATAEAREKEAFQGL